MLALCACLALTGVARAATEAAMECAGQLDNPVSKATPLPTTAQVEQLAILVWNVQKSSQRGWQEDFAKLTQDRHLLLLQEATTGSALERLWPSADVHFAPGFRMGHMQTGVMTVSRLNADVRCQLTAVEPVLRTPKAVAISRYDWAGGEPLLVINLHAVNFSAGMGSFEAQLDDLSAVMGAHRGPLLIGGDFNTWREKRLTALAALAGSHGMEAVRFNPDQRSQVWGRPLDHVLIRGLDVIEARSEPVATSDHNPLLLTVRRAAVPQLRQ